MSNNSNFDVPDVSGYTVIFGTSYGELSMDLEAAVVCMLSAVMSPDCEIEAAKAMAVIIRTELMCRYANSDNTEFNIFVEKTPFIKNYLTFSEQKQIYGEEYKANLEKYKQAALETAGRYMEDVIIGDELAEAQEFSVVEAEEMAKSGMDYAQILELFFTNIAIDKIE